MKITLSNNIDNVGVAIEANKDEISSVQKMKELAGKFQSEMTQAYEAAQMVWKHYPKFKQVTLDTMTDEERKLIELSKSGTNLS
jgi:hypothetical protein